MKTTTTTFSGYSPEQIAGWCLVSISTARAWKAGTKNPSRRAVKLFTLHARGKVLGKEWRGWTIREGVLYDPANQPMRREHMEAHVIIYQLASYCRANHMPQPWCTQSRG